jgi:hypothetical protein
MRPIVTLTRLVLTSLVVSVMLQGAPLAEDAAADPAVPGVPETVADTQVAQATQEASESADQETSDAQQASTEDDAGADKLLDQAQLDQLVAPIALYPDPLLAQVLVASTYPLEVVQAERWAEANKEVTGEALTQALEEKNWDNSIKALVAVPDVLAMMNKDLDWTAKLGDAVLAQQADVMAAVQRMRALAYKNGELESNDQQTVTVKQEVNVEQAPAASPSSGVQAPAPQDVIVIEPTSPETVYVPYYEPSVVYGTWPYPSYPPYYFPPPAGYAFGSALASGIAWSAGFAIGNAIWGDGFNWGRNNINVDINRNVDLNSKVDINNTNVNVSNWQHNSDHRRGVNYNNTEVRNKFSKGDLADKRDNFRGREPGDKLPGDRRTGDGGFADKRPGDKRPNVASMEQALKKSDLAAKRPGGGFADKKPGGGGLADKKPGGGDKRPAVSKPGMGDKRANLQKPDAMKRPDVKKPAAKRPDIKKPAAKKPNLTKTAARKPSGNAFDKRDGAKAKSYSKRGRSSAGNRSAAKLGGSRPSGHRGGGRGGGRRR